MRRAFNTAYLASAMLCCLMLCQATAFARKNKDHDADVRGSRRPMSSFADIDAAIPPVAAGMTCPAAQVVTSASERVKELVAIIPQITAVERVEHFECAGHDTWHPPQVVTFNYVAELQEVRPGMLHMQELRNGSTSPNLFPGRLADFGLPAIALI